MPSIPNAFVPLVSSYGLGGPSGAMRTETSGGPHRYALQWDRGVQRFSCSLALDAIQYAVWSAWYHRVIKKGAIPFDMRLDSGLGAHDHEVRLVPGSYSASSADGMMTVTFEVDGQSAVYALSDAQVSAYGLVANALPAGFTPVMSPYTIASPGGVVGDDIVGGNAFNALQWDRGVQQFSCTLILTRAQFATWAVWYHRVNASGTITFDMPINSGFGVEAHAANIIPGSYSVTRTGGILVVVSFAVEAESKAYQLTPDEAAGLVYLYEIAGADSNALLVRIAQFANVDSLVLDF